MEDDRGERAMNLKKWFQQWDEGNFDLTRETAGDLHAKRPPEHKVEDVVSNKPVEQLVQAEQRFFDRLYPVAMAFLSFSMIIILLITVSKMPSFESAATPANQNPVIARYIEEGLTETGAVNIVAGVILDYRAFDTLGESHVLFTATIAVFILMLLPQEEKEKKKEKDILLNDAILKETSKVLIPLILMFGIYIILNGHLGPGGGFSGGAVIGAGLILYSLSHEEKNLQRVLNMKTYKGIVLSALLFYGLSKCYSFFCGAHGLHTIFQTGIPGRILSAGLILPLNIAVGVVVACTMYGFYAIFTKGRI